MAVTKEKAFRKTKITDQQKQNGEDSIAHPEIETFDLIGHAIKGIYADKELAIESGGVPSHLNIANSFVTNPASPYPVTLKTIDSELNIAK